MPGERYGRYVVRREIGRGGMGVVYLAHDPAVSRDVALKVLPAGLPGDDHVIARLRQEARLTASLDHACIVPIFDVGEQDDRPFLVMRYMPGGTLDQRLHRGRLSLREAAPILLRVADALAAAHRQGIVHRDLKPSNILFDGSGEAYLSDFGIAKALGGSFTLSLTGTSIVGTPAYMSPEQAVGDRAIDGRSDTYSLGAVAFELLTGRQPYSGDTPMRVVLRHLQDPAPRLTEEELVGLDLPAEVGAALTRAMSKEPADRFASPLELALMIASAAGLPDPTTTTQRAAAASTATAASTSAETLAHAAITPTPQDRSTLPPTRPGGARPAPVVLISIGGLALVGALAVWTLRGGFAGPVAATATVTPAASATTAAIVTTAAAQPSPTASRTSTETATLTEPPDTATATRTSTATVTTTVTARPTATRPRPTVLPATATLAPSPTNPPPAPPATNAPPPGDPPTPTPAPPEPEVPTPTPAPP